MNNLNKDLYQEYVEIDEEIRQLQEKLNQIKLQISNELLENNVEKVATPFGTFFFKKKTTMEFLPEFEQKIKEFKKEKKIDYQILVEKAIEKNAVEIHEDVSLNYRKK